MTHPSDATDPESYYRAHIALEKSYMRVAVAWPVAAGESYEDTTTPVGASAHGSPRTLRAPRAGYEVTAYAPDGLNGSRFMARAEFAARMIPADHAPLAAPLEALPEGWRLTPVPKNGQFRQGSAGLAFRATASHPGMRLECGGQSFFMDMYQMAGSYLYPADLPRPPLADTFRVVAWRENPPQKGIVLPEAQTFLIDGAPRVAEPFGLLSWRQDALKPDVRVFSVSSPDYTRYALRESPGLRLIKG